MKMNFDFYSGIIDLKFIIFYLLSSEIHANNQSYIINAIFYFYASSSSSSD